MHNNSMFVYEYGLIYKNTILILYTSVTNKKVIKWILDRPLEKNEKRTFINVHFGLLKKLMPKNTCFFICDHYALNCDFSIKSL